VRIAKGRFERRLSRRGDPRADQRDLLDALKNGQMDPRRRQTGVVAAVALELRDGQGRGGGGLRWRSIHDEVALFPPARETGDDEQAAARSRKRSASPPSRVSSRTRAQAALEPEHLHGAQTDGDPTPRSRHSGLDYEAADPDDRAADLTVGEADRTAARPGDDRKKGWFGRAPGP